MNYLPFLEANGNNYEVGLAMGRFFSKQIRKEIEVIHAFQEDIQWFFDRLLPYKEQTEINFPHLLDEIMGIADGAGVDFNDIFLLNTREVYDLLDEGREENWEHCTIAASFNRDGGIVGHNEDWDESAQDELYILKANINGTQILALNYSGVMPGLSASMNNFGLVQCVNELQHTSEKIGVPKLILARAVLDCSYLEEAVELIETTPRATGFNHLLLQGDTIVDIETSANKTFHHRRTKQPFAHTNHYAFQPMIDEEDDSSLANSVARWKRARELLHEDMSVTDMMDLLRDRQNARHPICRLEATIGSVIMQPELQSAYFCYGPPCRGNYSKYTL
jgi:predicted choloylglycine hydrolase